MSGDKQTEMIVGMCVCVCVGGGGGGGGGGGFCLHTKVLLITCVLEEQGVALY